MKMREIAQLDLASFRRPFIAGNPSKLIRGSWYLLNAVILRNGILGLIPSSWKTALLRQYGAQIGRGVVIKPRVDIKSPWFLEVGDYVWIGEKTWIDNHTTVKIGSNTCISQGAYIFTGNHDWKDSSFSFFCKSVEIGQSVWITAFARIPPGSKIPDCTAIMPD